MDMSKYSGAAFRKVDDVKANGPIRVVIASIVEGKFGKPDITFDDSTKLSINATNNKILCQAYGTASDGWIGKEIELYVGDVEFQGGMQESVLVRPISPPIAKKKPPTKKSPAAAPAKEKPRRDDLNDEIPY